MGHHLLSATLLHLWSMGEAALERIDAKAILRASPKKGERVKAIRIWKYMICFRDFQVSHCSIYFGPMKIWENYENPVDLGIHYSQTNPDGTMEGTRTVLCGNKGTHMGRLCLAAIMALSENRAPKKNPLVNNRCPREHQFFMFVLQLQSTSFRHTQITVLGYISYIPIKFPGDHSFYSHSPSKSPRKKTWLSTSSGSKGGAGSLQSQEGAIGAGGIGEYDPIPHLD